VAIILDTDVIIRDERNSFDLKRWAALQSSEQFAVAAITVAELWHGVERATYAFKAEREVYVRGILNSVRIFPYTEATAMEHARLESFGKMIGYYDLIVAATALERGCAVATFNKRHFSQVRELKVIEPA
jgi:tRNA(fMet)-specific endonuclease VapC